MMGSDNHLSEHEKPNSAQMFSNGDRMVEVARHLNENRIRIIKQQQKQTIDL